MSEKNFLTISTDDCKSEYKAVLANSDLKLKSAELLANEQDYGSAISLLIISNEELIKALILFLDGQGFELRSVKGMKSLFNNHRLRYLLWMVFSVLANFGEDIRDILNKVRKNPQILQDMMDDKKEMGKQLQSYLLKKQAPIQDEIAFFSQVDKMRQIGLYTDKPGDKKLTEKDYQHYYVKVSKLKKIIINLIDSFQLNEVEEQVRKLKTQCKHEGWYNNIAMLISIINNPKMDSYQNLSERVKMFGQEIADADGFGE